MGQFRLDLSASGSHLATYDSEALVRARENFHKIKKGVPGWEKAASDVVDIARAQAMRCPDKSGRDGLLQAFVDKVERLHPAAASSPHRTYGLKKLSRQLSPNMLSEDVMACMKKAPADLRGTVELQNLALDLTYFLGSLEREGPNLQTFQRLKPTGERYRAMIEGSKLHAQRAGLPALREALVAKLTPLVGMGAASTIAVEAAQRVDDALTGSQSKYAITSAVDTWIWGQAVNSRNKRAPVMKVDVEGPVEAFFKGSVVETEAFREALDDLLEQALNGYDDDSQGVKDCELLIDRLSEVAQELAEEMPALDGGTMSDAASDAWDALSETFLAEAESIGEVSAVRMLEEQLRRNPQDERLPKDELHWQFHLRVEEADKAMKTRLDAALENRVRAWKKRFDRGSTPDTVWLRERADFKASNGRLMKQLKIIEERRAAVSNQSLASRLSPPRPLRGHGVSRTPHSHARRH